MSTTIETRLAWRRRSDGVWCLGHEADTGHCLAYVAKGWDGTRGRCYQPNVKVNGVYCTIMSDPSLQRAMRACETWLRTPGAL